MSDLAEYKDREAAHKDHIENYRTRGYEKGKYEDNAPDKYRIDRLKDPIKPGSVILDVGCNDGGLGMLLQREGNVVYGVDLVQELVDLACAKGVIASQGCVEELKFKDGYFDIVVMAEVLEHLYDPCDGLTEIVRVLDNDGLFIGSVPHPNGNMGHGHKADYHQNVFDEKGLYDLLSKHFKTVELESTPYHEDYCKAYNINPVMKQWTNWVCSGVIKNG